MNYKLSVKDAQQKDSFFTALSRLTPLLKGEGGILAWVAFAVLLNAGATLLAPVIIAHAIDAYITVGNYGGVIGLSGLLLLVYAVALLANYAQTRLMGGVGRRVLFNLRNELFMRIQELPVAFFNQNKAGDLISRINNDTDQLNQFFSQALMQFLGSFFLILGSGIFLLSLDVRLGTAALIPALFVLTVTQLLSGWVKRKNLRSLQSLGGLSAEIQESLENFRVIVAFDRHDYFREKFNEANERNYVASVGAGIANNIFTPLYTLASSLAQLIVLALGIYFISQGQFSVGLLIGYFLYVNNFYGPLRQLASVWSSLQLALAALDRISEVLSIRSDMELLPESEKEPGAPLVEFRNVSFSYADGKEVLRNIDMRLQRGKTYALVGPTGGGKTTTASLMARLFDPTSGIVLLDGHDIRSVEPAVRARKIGFILQEPFLFSGTVRDNIVYGNEGYLDYTNEELALTLHNLGLESLLKRFEQGLDTVVGTSSGTMSLGQRQLIAFMRAMLRRPELLILDEATANVDTVTEKILEEILDRLPAETTRVIIAHRLNTIANADEIFFVNGGTIQSAGSMEHAVELLLHHKRES